MKRFGLLIAALLISMNFYAQLWDNSKPDKYWTFGVRAGMNLSTKNYNGDYTLDFDYKIGYHVGAIVDYNIIKSLVVESGVIYSQQRYKFKVGLKLDNNIRNKDKYIETNNFVMIPFSIIYHVPFDPFKMYLKAGVYEAVEKNAQLGYLIGYGLGYKKFLFEMQYEIGGRRADDTSNRNLAFTLGYNF